MGNGCGKCKNINVDEQLVIDSCTERTLINGPILCQCYSIFSSGTKVKQLELKLNEYALVTNEFEPEKNRFEYGPNIIRLLSPWENFGPVKECPILDQDDYIVVTQANGEKYTFRGPGVFKPEYGQKWSNSANAIIVPINHYIVIKDNNDTEHPIKHIQGPAKFIPEPYQTFVKNGNTELYKCIEITELKAIYLQKADGNIILFDKPMYYMLNVGESVASTVEKSIMISSDFCIIKGPDGKTFILDGTNEKNRSFYLKPFYSFISFNFGTQTKTILSTLPTFISHKFSIRTNDNVLLDLDLRISYQIFNVNIFGSNPIDFYQHIINWCQNELLDLFAKLTLRDFMKSYSSVAMESITNGTNYFEKFGIAIIDIQILNYICQDSNTQNLLLKDIQTNVIKQNELKAKETDILIKEKENIISLKLKDMEIESTKKDIEIDLKKKDMNVQISEKDNEIAIKKKELEVSLRLKELELQIDEENMRLKLLDVQRINAVKEGEFEGKAQGASVNEFIKTIENIDVNEKINMWNKLRDLDKATLIYSKVNSINMYPPNSDLKIFQFDNDNENNNVPCKKNSFDNTTIIPRILQYDCANPN